MTRAELNQIGSKLGINCGGSGGTPGPCPTGDRRTTHIGSTHLHGFGNFARSDTERLAKTLTPEQNIKKAKFHDKQSTKFKKRGIEYPLSKETNDDRAAHHDEMASIHRKAAEGR